MSELNPKTIPEAVEQLEKFLKHYSEKLGRKFSVEKFGDFNSDEPEDSDLCVMINSWLIITPFLKTENVPCINVIWSKPITSICYRISKEVFYRSCSRHDPDEVDIVDVLIDIKGLLLVIEKAIHILIQNDIEGIAENLETDDMLHEEETYSKQEGI
jgi:hypothetical protein